MRRTVPILIAAVSGCVLIITTFLPATVTWGETAAVWFDVLAAIAFVLGGGNLLKVHLQKVSDRAAGWAYSLITVVTFLLTLAVGLFKLGVPPAIDQEFYGETFVPLAVEQIPEELFHRLEVDLPAKFAEDELPDTVKRQFRIVLADGENGEQIQELQFTGWMMPGQRDDLLGLHDVLAWKCAIEKLFAVSALPPSLDGQIRYDVSHGSLSATEPVTADAFAELTAVSSTPAWQTAVTTLQERSNTTTSIEVAAVPADFAVPDSLADRVQLAGTTLSVTGPFGPADKATLADAFPHPRPMSETQIEGFIEQLAAVGQASPGGGLTAAQQNTARGLLRNSWQVDQLVAVLNDAGKRPAVTKTYCELFDEQQAGVIDLQPTRPATDPDVTLNDQQIAAIRAFATTPATTRDALAAELKVLGDFIPAQSAALIRFLAGTPTIGQRNRALAAALTAGPDTLTADQLEFLLADYRAEHNWNEQLHALLVASHQVKYPWSGGYLQTGSPFWWSYEYAFKPLTATMFALLAFYVASAAFRAFRAKNFEALLLLGTAFIVLLGRTPLGPWLTSGLPEELAMLRIENITAFVMSVINTAGNRAIMIGIALGIVSTSLKILLGVDRSYLGTGD